MQEKPLKQATNKINNNDFLLDQGRLDGMEKQEKLPQQDNNNFFLDQTHPVGLHKQESRLSPFQAPKPLTKNKNHTSLSDKAGQGSALPNAPSLHANSSSMNGQSSEWSSSDAKVLQNDLEKKNISVSDSHNEWFTNATLAKTNTSVENSTVSSQRNDQSSKEQYTAADYLQTLYPQLSAFKAPLEKLKGNASLTPSLLSSLLHENGTLKKHTSLSPRHDSKDELGKLRNTGLGPTKIAAERQLEAQKELLASLLKVDSMLGERSAIKQNHNSPRYSSSSRLLLTRSKKPGKQVPGHKYLTESGAKLLPAHIFSPLGSQFKDPLEPSSTASPEKSISTTPAKTSFAQEGDVAPILPTQSGQIQSQTQNHAGKEPSTVPVIVPTQSGMIATAAKVSDQTQVIIRPTLGHDKESEALIPPTMPTTLMSAKNPYAPTQSGFIPAQLPPVKTTLPTGAPFVPTQIEFIPSATQKGKIWKGPPEENSERKDTKPDISKQRLSSHETTKAEKGQTKFGLSHFSVKPRRLGKTYRRPHFLNRRIADLPPVHSREKRQMFVPLSLMQTNNNAQQLSQSLLPGQLAGQSLFPNLPQIPQLQQPVQQFSPTQPLQGFLPQLFQSPQAVTDPMSLLGQPGKHSHSTLPYVKVSMVLMSANVITLAI